MRINTEQRRARLAVRHRLATACRAERVEEVAESLVALHATDPATVHLSAAARLVRPSVEDVERALYDDHTLLRMLAMRRTMFVFPAGTATVAHHAASVDVARRERARLVKQLTEDGHPEGVPDAANWLAGIEDATAKVLARRGSATAQQVVADEPRLRQQLVMARGKPYQAIVNVTGRVLNLLALDGRIVRGRPRGSWISSQYAWAPLEEWLPGGLVPWEPAAARADLARRWLRAFGPATVADLRWWSGWSLGQTRQALSALDAVEVDLDGLPGIVLADDVDPVTSPEPWVALLPGLDATPMGWAERGWFLGPHKAAVFDGNGNIGPTVWCDGRIVGGWAQRPSGEVAFRLLEDIGGEASAAVEEEAARVTGWLGGVCVTPRFRTPLERELAG